MYVDVSPVRTSSVQMLRLKILGIYIFLIKVHTAGLQLKSKQKVNFLQTIKFLITGR